jgi:hypothetical protein
MLAKGTLFLLLVDFERALLAHAHIVEDRVGCSGIIVVVVIRQGQGVGMTCRHACRHLGPRRAVGADMGQDGRGRSARVVLERGGHPVRGTQASRNSA